MKKTTILLRGVFLLACCLVAAGVSYAQQVDFTTSEFTSATSDGTTSTWTVPAGVNTISIIAIGGGGGGGAVCPSFWSSAVRGCAGGGGGAYVKVDAYPVTPGDELTIHVGSKGSGHQSCSGTYRGWGGDSWVKLGTDLIALAKGASDVSDGSVDVPGTGGQASACTGDHKYSGGNGGKGSTGAWCGSGGGGAAGGGNGGDGSEPTWTYVVIRHDHPGTAGTTSRPYAGNGAAGVVSHTGGTNGSSGKNYGGGGSGGSSGIGWGNANGGDGGPGYVLITYSVSCDATAGSIAPGTWECSATDTAVVITSVADATSTASGSYMWQKSTDNSTWSNISGANAAQYTADATGYYRRGYTVGSCPTVYTNSVNVTRPSDINPGTLQDGDNKTEKKVCAGDAVNITLSKSYSGNVTWQTSPDKVTWTNVSTSATYSITSVTATTYVRYLAEYSATCGLPSNNVYTITVNELPVVNSITTPADLCPGESSYEVIANITSNAAIATYTWTGVTSYNGAIAQIVPSGYECNRTYNYSLKLTDENGCESAVKTGSFTTSAPSMAFGAVSLDATTNTTDCKYYVPAEAVLTSAVNDALTSSCGNEVSLSNINPAAGSELEATSTVTATATDKCGNTQSVSIEVVVPTFSITAPAPETFTLPYGESEMTVTIEGTPTFTPADGAFTFGNNLQNPLSVGDHEIVWTLYDACGKIIATTEGNPQIIHVVLPDCETPVTLDGYDYPVVRVGYDCWFKENVKATTGIDGAVSYNNEAANKDKFGMLYTWKAAVASSDAGTASNETPAYTQGVCPEGWSIPTEEDFQRLFVNAGSDVDYLKDLDASTWITGKAGKTPSTGFDMRGAGYFLSSVNAFHDLLSNTRFWTDKSNADETIATCVEFNYYCSEPMFKEVSATDKVSIRCIRRNVEPTEPTEP